MTNSEQLEYILDLQAKQSEQRIKRLIESAKIASKHECIAFMTSFIASQTTNLCLASLGLAKRNGE